MQHQLCMEACWCPEKKKRKNENIRMIKIKILIVNKDYKILSQDSKSSQ